MAELYLRQMLSSVFLVLIYVCVTQVDVVHATGSRIFCGRDCSNTCLNNTCQRFLYECKFGCKSGLNVTGCPKDVSTTTTPGAPKPTKGAQQNSKGNTGVVIGAAAGVSAVVIIIVVVVAVVIVKRRTKSRPRTAEQSGYTNRVAFSKDAKESETYDEIPSDRQYRTATQDLYYEQPQ